MEQLVSRIPEFLVASLITSYPDESFTAQLGRVMSEADLPERLRADLDRLVSDVDALNDMRSEFIDTFDRGKESNSLYETEYGRERAMVKGGELVDIVGFYRAFGFETGGEGVKAEMHDHVAVELEFYALLLLKEAALSESGDADGVAITRDARGKFLRDHLGTFTSAILKRPGVVASPYFSQVFGFVNTLVATECATLGVEAVEDPWLASQAEAPEMACGGGTACTV